MVSQQELWAKFRELNGPRPMGRGAQARWEAEWVRFQAAQSNEGA